MIEILVIQSIHDLGWPKPGTNFIFKGDCPRNPDCKMTIYYYEVLRADTRIVYETRACKYEDVTWKEK